MRSALQAVTLAPEQTRRDRVEGPDPEATRCLSEEVRDPLTHHPGGLVGKRHGEDPLGPLALLLDETGDPSRQNTCLARPRTGEDQERTGPVLDRVPLLGVESQARHASVPASGREIAKLAPVSVGSRLMEPL
jgi:hypothetical protein